jgi:hypothetical protein
VCSYGILTTRLHCNFRGRRVVVYARVGARVIVAVLGAFSLLEWAVMASAAATALALFWPVEDDDYAA